MNDALIHPNDRSGAGFSVGFLVSLVLHAAVGLLFVTVGARASSPLVDAPPRPLTLPPKIIELGEPDSQAQTITWIGDTEPEEHEALFSETEQALQSLDTAPIVAPEPEQEAATAAPPTVVDVVAEAPAPEPADAAEPTPVEEAPSDTTVSAPNEPVLREQPIEDPVDDPIVVAPSDDLEIEPIVGPEPAQQTESVQPEAIEPIEQQIPETSEQNPSPTDEPTPPTDAPSPATDQTNQQPTPLIEPPAVPSDREAVATSIKEATRYKPGRPLASEGLRILTKNPELSHFNALFARYRPPVARIFFGRDGKVVDVVLLQDSQHPDIDRNTLDALFQWRAEGPALEALKPTSATPPPNRLIDDKSLPVGEFNRLGQRTLAVDIRIIP